MLYKTPNSDEPTRTANLDGLSQLDTRSQDDEVYDFIQSVIPTHFGRYRVDSLLGRGGFGLVYLAWDEQLERPVALKVPHSRKVPNEAIARVYLTEARAAAALDHPNIVTVYDVGSTETCPCFIVSKYIQGRNLRTRLTEAPVTQAEAIHLIATVADALHYAHSNGLVHRDIKPSNLLLDTKGVPYVVDFGLALRDRDVGPRQSVAGTPAYMSPEQARGEGHRVDGRSDIFSLGVVFYEMLVGSRPFSAESNAKILAQVVTCEPKPLRQQNSAIPKELERICFKALAKRASDRYSRASDLADDLRHFLSQLRIAQPDETSGNVSQVPAAETMVTSTNSQSTLSDSQPLHVIPKGLRSFDAHDAEFFLELLHGPRDREGLTECLRFWKSSIEERDPEKTFAVGLIYGPSGCGKSSLVKAGLLPRLDDSVIALYVEATAEDTEARLLKQLRKLCPELPDSLSLKDILTFLRRGYCSLSGKKVLIVLDQFEQWLHAKKEETNTELVESLRQCDGGKLQCIVLVRDDFWLAISRFMHELEVRLVEGQNSSLVDLFPIWHAEKVLASFGRAFGTLSCDTNQLSKDQKQFLEKAVTGLAQDGKVISVRLALFAEMMKEKPWTLATLKAVGGTEGVGIAFLEETFSSATASPEHRYHQKAAREVLKALLPESGTDIKGHMRSYTELLEASGYKNHPEAFETLLQILDGEIRLITPTDPEGQDGLTRQPHSTQPDQKYYQLTHDYLVPSLREWLTRKQKETRKGRAELLLNDRASEWNSRPENRLLPSLIQWISIRWLTRKSLWTPPERNMMQKAGRVHLFRGFTFALLLLLVISAGSMVLSRVRQEQNAILAANYVQAILKSDIEQVPAYIQELTDYRKWADPLLQEEFAKAELRSAHKLRASLALLPGDTSQIDFLYARLLDADPREVAVVRDALYPHKDILLESLWNVAKNPEPRMQSKALRAALALALYDQNSKDWPTVSVRVVEQLVNENPLFTRIWLDGFRPVRLKLQVSLEEKFRDRTLRDLERNIATNILVDYVLDQEETLPRLLMDADENQFGIIYPRFKEQRERWKSVLVNEISRTPSKALSYSDQELETLAKRKATASMALLRINLTAPVWPLLKHSEDPRTRSYLINRMNLYGVNPKTILKRLAIEKDITIRRALILALGEYPSTSFEDEDWEAIVPRLQGYYLAEDDPGIHAAVEWVLRTWKMEDWLAQANQQFASDAESRNKKLDKIQQDIVSLKEKSPKSWYVNSQGQTFVSLPGPIRFDMGAPLTEKDRADIEPLHTRVINRTFAIATKPVTLEQYQKLVNPQYKIDKKYMRFPDLPVVGIDWYLAANYCNALSRAENLEECYVIDPMKPYEVVIKPNYLQLSGYRLPTEAEMEYATRADSRTSRFYGETEELLEKYAWYTKNTEDQQQRVGTKKPNDFGLFDVQGNCFTWCQETHNNYLKHAKPGNMVEDVETAVKDLEVNPKVGRTLRGHAFYSLPIYIRSASRYNRDPGSRDINFGFRPVRTILPK